LLANGERKLRVIHDHFHVLFHGIENRDAAHLRRAQRVGGEDHGVVREFDDVDFFTAQLANDRLHTHALHAHAGADAIHVAVAAEYGNLGAFAGFARAALDLHRAVVDFGHFLLEQAHDQFRRRARHQHARPLARLIDQADDAADAVARAVTFQARLLALREARFGLAQIEHIVRTFDAL